MALTPYTNIPGIYSGAGILDAHDQGMSSRNLLTAIGDYWQEYFADPDLLMANLSGMNVLLTTEYTRMLQMVLSSNIINIPVECPFEYDLLVFSSEKASYIVNEQNEVQYISYQFKQGQSIDFLVSSLMEPTIALQQGVHFDIIDEEIRFYVDIFYDRGILDGVYSTVTDTASFVLFWASSVLLKESYIFDRFGTYLYNQEYDSETYKTVLTALQFFYAQTKSIKNIEAIINILYGLPYSRFQNEQVISIEETDLQTDPEGMPVTQTLITTNHAQYVVQPYSNILTGVGGDLEQYQLLARWHTVHDYITNPTWYDGARIPKDLIESFTHPGIPLTWITNLYNGVDSYEGSIVMENPDPNSNPFWSIRSRHEGLGYEEYLYNLYDQILKYNIVYFLTILNFENYQYLGARLPSLYEAIRTGFPVYLYPMFETIFRIVFEDDVSPPEITELIRARLADPLEEFEYSGVIHRYDGLHTYGPAVTYYYDGNNSYTDPTTYNNHFQIYHGSDTREVLQVNKATIAAHAEVSPEPREADSHFYNGDLTHSGESYYENREYYVAAVFKAQEGVSEAFEIQFRSMKSVPVEENVAFSMGSGLTYSGALVYDYETVYGADTPEYFKPYRKYDGSVAYQIQAIHNTHTYLRYSEDREVANLNVRGLSGTVVQSFEI